MNTDSKLQTQNKDRSLLPLVRNMPGDVVWDIYQHSHELAAVIDRQHAWISACVAEFRNAIPAARLIEPLDDGLCVRPVRHLRAFYARHPQSSSVLGIKGTEIHADDRLQKLQSLKLYRVDYPSRGRSLFSAAEHFPIVEHKVPLAVTLPEALEDVSFALALQEAHVRRFGCLARVPVPLLIVRWSDRSVEQFRAELVGHFSLRAQRIVDLALDSGLGCFIYHYPMTPLRVAHFDSGQTGSYRENLARLRQHLDPKAVIEGWIQLAVRMLVLGFLPGSIESIGIGHCLEA
jgi:hypothetical protein